MDRCNFPHFVLVAATLLALFPVPGLSGRARIVNGEVAPDDRFNYQVGGGLPYSMSIKKKLNTSTDHFPVPNKVFLAPQNIYCARTKLDLKLIYCLARFAKKSWTIFTSGTVNSAHAPHRCTKNAQKNI